MSEHVAIRFEGGPLHGEQRMAAHGSFYEVALPPPLPMVYRPDAALEPMHCRRLVYVPKNISLAEAVERYIRGEPIVMVPEQTQRSDRRPVDHRSN